MKRKDTEKKNYLGVQQRLLSLGPNVVHQKLPAVASRLRSRFATHISDGNKREGPGFRAPKRTRPINRTRNIVLPCTEDIEKSGLILVSTVVLVTNSLTRGRQS